MTNYTHVKRFEREEIAQLLHQGLSKTEIARRLGRDRTTIYRELARNRNELGNYVAKTANRLAKRRRRKARKRKIVEIVELRTYIGERLQKGWSPEQISGRLKIEALPYTVCAETIYRFIYGLQQDTGCQEWWRLLTRRKRQRTNRSGRRSRKQRLIERHQHISQRPAEVETREVLGHWEGDTMRFIKRWRSNVTTLVERLSRLLLLIKNEDGKSETVIGGIKDFMEDSQPKTKLYLSTTVDEGPEFARNAPLRRYVKQGVYFCDPASPQQRGTNENTNGRLRRDLPRDINIDEITQQQLNAIADKHNNTPRKCLGWATPVEAFMRAYGKKSRWPKVGPFVLKTTSKPLEKH